MSRPEIRTRHFQDTNQKHNRLRIQIDSGARPPNDLPRWAKRPGRKAEHSPPTSAKKNGAAMPPLPYIFMAESIVN
jgi:hypothetical protein